MKTPPRWFVRALEVLDPLLDVRWGSFVGSWVIERKAFVSPEEMHWLRRRVSRTKRLVDFPPADASPQVKVKNTQTYIGLAEELVSAEVGKRVIVIVQELNQAAYDLLVMSDIKRYGGYARFADAIEEKESRKQTDGERVLENKRHAMNLEIADMMHFVWRKKEDALLNGHRNMNYLLHGKESNKPVIQLTDV